MYAGTFPVDAPGLSKTVAEVPDCEPDQAGRALSAAVGAQPGWEAESVQARAALVAGLRDRIAARRGLYAAAIALESGKVRGNADKEVDVALATLAELLEVHEQAVRPEEGRYRSDPDLEVGLAPVGPSLLITPWNFPLSLPIRKVASSLLAGCPFILKPAEETPMTAALIGQDLDAAGMPAGVGAVLPTAQPAAVVESLMARPSLRKVSFTGSVEVGRVMVRNSAEHFQRVSLELGGNAAVVIGRIDDLEQCLTDVLAGKLANSGQACISPNRLYIVRDQMSDAIDILRGKLDEVAVGWDLRDDRFQVGPLINLAAAKKIQDLLGHARAAGASVLQPAGSSELGENYVLPAIVTNADESWPVVEEEIFGPVLPLLPYDRVDEAVAAANRTDYGLAHYIYSDDPREADNLSSLLEAGMVGVNRPSVSDPRIPFGGIKHSGYGRENGIDGIREFMTPRSRIGRGFRVS
ncbi:aldehyde dehydrogenase family protein [Egibacter rhizosphaerae]|nr:aldehyde dehydrogenase family protein [Egibacter rhizosphaerae]